MRLGSDSVQLITGLEALIAHLNTQLGVLAGRLTSHQSLISELRALRSHDSAEIREKGRDVEKMRLEIERLANEVESIRRVVNEQGLKRRERETRPSAPEPSQQRRPASFPSQQPQQQQRSVHYEDMQPSYPEPPRPTQVSHQHGPPSSPPLTPRTALIRKRLMEKEQERAIAQVCHFDVS